MMHRHFGYFVLSGVVMLEPRAADFFLTSFFGAEAGAPKIRPKPTPKPPQKLQVHAKPGFSSSVPITKGPPRLASVPMTSKLDGGW